MDIKNLLFASLILMGGGIANSCSPKITSNLINKQSELSSEDKVAFLDTNHKLPDSTILVGNLRFQDSGFTTNCSFNSLMNQARKEARKNGANIIKITQKRLPDIWSSCYRLKIELHRYEGDLSQLKQFQLSLD